ncbi:MAG: 3-deoxy-7-phosphoheptulonate synthase, partial [Nitrospinae bacterium]|nr:3-deoxy-7-phosphoheptulonate synthase [Nitrospinota bacterium]
MIIVMSPDATPEQLEKVKDTIRELGYTPHIISGVERNVIGAVGDERGKDRLQSIETMGGVESVFPILKPYKLASRELKSTPSVIKAGGIDIGGPAIAIIAGPCSVESKDQICTTANLVKEAGANFLRGGAYKPRTSPYSFQGMEEDGLKLLAAAKEVSGLPIVTEVMNPREIDLVAKYADVVQVGARNMQNFSLLKELGKIDKPILLKRGMMNTIKEFLMSAEYVLSEGNSNMILCERGIRTF